MRLRSMDPSDEPAWWRWPVVVELRLIAGDVVRAVRWVRRILARAWYAFQKRIPALWPECCRCGEIKLPPAPWLVPFDPICRDCMRTEVRSQAEEFNAILDQHMRDHERRRAAGEFDHLGAMMREAREPSSE